MLANKDIINAVIKTTAIIGGKILIKLRNNMNEIVRDMGNKIDQKRKIPFVVKDNELLQLGQFHTLGFKSNQIVNMEI